MPRPTILDVLDNVTADGEPALDALCAGRLRAPALLERAREFYESWDPPPSRPEELRIHPITRESRGYCLMPAVAALMTSEEIEQADRAYEGDGFTLERLQRAYATAFLCADVVVELDPISFLVAQHPPGSTSRETELRIGLIAAVWHVEKVRPLIEHGLILLQPVPTQEDWNEDYSRAQSQLGESNPYTENRLAQTISALRIAGLTESTVLPMWRGTWRKLAMLVDGDRLTRAGLDIKIVAALGEVELPWLGGITPKTLVRIHQEEEAFLEWRAALRAASRTIGAEPGAANFSREAQAAIEDLLLPQLHAAKRSLSRSHALREAAKDQPLRVGLSSAAAAGSALVAGLPLSTAIASSAAAALGGSLAPAIARRPPRGPARVIFELLK